MEIPYVYRSSMKYFIYQIGESQWNIFNWKTIMLCVFGVATDWRKRTFPSYELVHQLVDRAQAKENVNIWRKKWGNYEMQNTSIFWRTKWLCFLCFYNSHWVFNRCLGSIVGYCHDFLNFYGSRKYVLILQHVLV